MAIIKEIEIRFILNLNYFLIFIKLFEAFSSWNLVNGAFYTNLTQVTWSDSKVYIFQFAAKS